MRVWYEYIGLVPGGWSMRSCNARQSEEVVDEAKEKGTFGRGKGRRRRGKGPVEEVICSKTGQLFP